MHEGWSVHHAPDEGVSFLIGMRWRALWRLARHPWVPIAFARMLRAHPETGLQATRFSVRPAGPVVIQRWRSADDVQRWARAGGEAHAAPWSRFRGEVGGTSEWGIWHEVRGLRRRAR